MYDFLSIYIFVLDVVLILLSAYNIIMSTFHFYSLSCKFQVVMPLFTCNYTNKMLLINDLKGGRQDLHVQVLILFIM
jgi:hypothetical protein